MNVLTDRQDAFGHAMLDCLRGKTPGAVIERDDGFIEPLWTPEQYFAPLKAWPTHQRRAVRLARGRVLDIGCGAGRVSLHLQRKGLDVTAIDVSPLAVKVCRLQGIRKARLISAGAIDGRLGAFDTFVLYGNNFGLMGNPSATGRLLRRLSKVARPDARVLAESIDPYLVKDSCHLQYHRRNRERGRMAGQLRIRIRYRRYATPWFDHLFVSLDEMRQIVAGAGWKVTGVLGATGRALYAAILEKELPEVRA